MQKVIESLDPFKIPSWKPKSLHYFCKQLILINVVMAEVSWNFTTNIRMLLHLKCNFLYEFCPNLSSRCQSKWKIGKKNSISTNRIRHEISELKGSSPLQAFHHNHFLRKCFSETSRSYKPFRSDWSKFHMRKNIQTGSDKCFCQIVC